MTSRPNTPEHVAPWMLEQLETETYIYQKTVVFEIEEKFGRQFTYDNPKGNLDVLCAFGKLTKDSVVWEKGNCCWRKRVPGDEPGRQQN